MSAHEPDPAEPAPVPQPVQPDVARTRRGVAGISRVTIVVMLLAVAGLGLGWLTKAPCLDTKTTGSGLAYLNWDDYRQYENYCYSDTIPLYGLEKLEDGGFPYKTSWSDPGSTEARYMEYPVVTGLLQYGVTVVTKDWLSITGASQFPDPPEVVVYFTIMAVVLALAWLVAVGLTLPLAARPRDVALMALSPLVFVHAFTNFDTLAVAFAAGGLWAWARQKPILAGVLLGIGGAAKLYPLFVLGPLLVLCFRTRTLGPWWKAAAGAVVAWLAVNLPIALLYPRGWWEFFRLNSTRPADHDSIYNAIAGLWGWGGFDRQLTAGESPKVLNLVSLALFVALCIGIALIAWLAPRRPRVASLVFLVVAAFLLTNKVWSPQYSLWLVPLAVLALPRWLPLITWMAVDAYLWVPRLGYFLHMADPTRGNSTEYFLRVVLVRDALVLGLCAWIIWTIFRPESDPVRATGADDPAGGVLDGAADRSGRLAGARPEPPRSHGSRRAPTGPDPAPDPRSAG